MTELINNDSAYFAHKALSASQIKTYATAGAYDFWKTSVFNPDKKPDEETDALIFGKLAHCMLFEQEEVENRFLIMDWGTKTRGTKKYEDAKSAYPDKTLITPAEYEKAGNMLACLRGHRLAREILKDAYCEKPILWTDKETGLPMKCKIDAFKRTKYGLVIIDYKTSSDIDGVLRRAEKFQYPLQDCTYCDAVKEKYGEDPIEFVFIIQSNKEGEEDKICVANVEPDSRMYARDVYNSVKSEIATKLKQWDETHDPNIWAAYPERMTIGYSNWYLENGY
ncbi:MAG: PD-(D/E)XK nuclease-like domain-containing protein [Clostridia bacterium]|nr:PD-(D/E)XK nuclease-like domain-containing protein [Clostridia bacterium]